ncbi:amino acid adenylation domain-containing protein [Saccharomonospora piscinae]|uniref:non-ribosomal peptide synthetase/type I polyketide synthase n=1 Tax=Saccharomonospora piscinae TaxID=687388 RepID=UPI0011068EE3|nr:non-ribosomal peptide synthetase/type I polyketide synthase [Saccharomonospora piscinae]TLW94620.1 amino acid adenylation domain-containing protein [Saccharomonospora piscinae]
MSEYLAAEGGEPPAVAVIGMAARMPGAPEIDSFWRNLRSGVESVTELDDDTLIANGADPAMLAEHRYVRSVITLAGIEEFDAGFFGFSPRDAAILDPQQRLFLECAWQALEDAAVVPGAGDASIGVYAASTLSGYLLANLLRGRVYDASPDSFQLLVANDKDYLASRVSYQFDLDGPAVAVQTACSSSMVAVHLGAQALLSYECDVALAGGVTVRVPHGNGYLHQEGSIFSADGHCRPFDARATGTAIGSGAGAVVLKRLDDAVADGDRIDAVLLGSAMNNDGASKVGYTAPSVEGQARAVAGALAVAGVSPETVDAVEAHGTGTPLGDPIEVAALTKVFGEGTGRSHPCLLGSVKSNIGHLDSAAGIASFIKAVLQLREGELVPSLNFTEPNPEIDFNRTPFRVATTTTAWKRNGSPRRIGVSSFGFGGTNVHAVLQQAPPRPPEGPRRNVHVLTLSAQGKHALDERASDLAAALRGAHGTEPDPRTDLADVARTLQTGRKDFRHRRIAVIEDALGAEGAATALAEPDPERVFTRRAPAGQPELCWLLPGQGSQYPGMGAQLYEQEPAFRAVVDDAADILRPELEIDLRELLYPPEDADPERAAEQLRQTSYAQPALFVVQTALATLLWDRGARPDAMLGHSIGEITAAHLAGVLDLPDALRLVALRGRLMQEQPSGAMVAVGLGEDELRRTLPPTLSIAAVNAPELCVVSGPHAAVDAFRDELSETGVHTRGLHTSHAFHSEMMRPAARGVADFLTGVSLRAPHERVVSNRTGDWLTAEQATDPHYWAGQILDPVRFAAGFARVSGAAEHPVCLEVGPGHTLTSLVKVCPEGKRTHTATTLRAAGEQGSDTVTLATALGRLWLSGVEVDFAAVDAHAPRRRVSLPGYPMQRRRYWIPAGSPSAGGPLTLDTGVGGDSADSAVDDAEGRVESGLPASGREPRPELDAEFTEPDTELQRRIAGIWQELLGVEPVGLHDPFLELGGHSLLAIKVVQRIEQELKVTIPLRRLVRAGTVGKLAELAAELGAESSDERTGIPQAVAHPEQRYEPFPLTEIQQAQWIGRQGNFQLGNVAAHVYFEVAAGELDLDRLQGAWNAVEQRHPMLHAVLTDAGTQRVLPDVGPYELTVRDLRDHDDAQVAAELDELRERLSHEMRPVDRWPLFDIVVARLPERRHRVFISFDLLIADIGSIRILLRDWGRAYAAERPALAPLGISYRDYVLAASEIRGTELYQRSLEYWRERARRLPPPPQLPLARNPAELTEPRFGSHGRLLPTDVWQRLVDRGAQHGVTASSILLAAYGVVLGRWTRESRFTVNVTVTNRFEVHPDVEDLVGEFASFDLLPIDLGSGSFAEIADALQEQSWSDLEYRYLNGVEVLRELAREQGGNAGGMPVVFTSTLVQQAESPDESLLGWLGDIVHEAAQTPQVWLDGAAIQVSDGVYLSWLGIDELFPDGLLEQMLDAYAALLRELADSDEPWSRIPGPRLPPRDRELVERANDTGGALPEGLLCDRLGEQIRIRPDAIAVVAPDATLTYGELGAHAGALAHRLRALGVGPGQLVAVSLPKSAAQIAAVLGVHWAGGAYLPVDPELPAQRQDHLVERGRCRVAVVAPDGRTEWPEGVRALDLDLTADPGTAEMPESLARPDDLAYVIFTSGSTGDPKGVAVSHRAALNTCVDICERFGVGADDRVLGLSSLSFDLSVWDVFGLLGAGGTLVLPEPDARRDPQRWLDLVRRHGITVWNSVPALAQMFADHARGAGETTLPLRLALLSGDWIPLDLADRLREVASGCRVISLGGATEAAIWSIHYEIAEIDPAWDSIPYGTPLRNQSFHVLGQRWQECPVHVTGELYIGGAGLADGYFGDGERTAAQFVTHPDTGQRLYRTGDLGRWRPDGTIEFLGREDFQVKVGGYRVELGEIEAAALRHPEIGTAVVTAFGDRHHKRLVGYLIPAVGGETDTDDLLADVERHLHGELPSYMVPPTLLVVSELPLTGNGKVDRSALPDPAASAEHGEFDAAADALTERLVAMISEVLGVEAVDPARGFLEAGGDSIRAVQLVSRANAEGLDLTLQDLFELPTLRHAAAACQARSGAAVDSTGERLPISADQATRLAASPGARWASVAVEPDVDAGLVGRASAWLLARHPALRLRLVEEPEGGIGQTIAPVDDEPPYVPLVDLSALPELRRQHALSAMIEEMAGELDPVRGPVARAALFDLDAHDRRLIWLAHELVADEASWTTMLRDLDAVLADLRSGTEPAPPPVCTAFAEWVRAEGGPTRSTVPEPRASAAIEHTLSEEPVTARAELTGEETEALVYGVAESYRMRLDEACFAALALVLGDAGLPGCAVERDGRDTAAEGAVGPFTVSGAVALVPVSQPGGAGNAAVAAMRAALTDAKSTYRARSAVRGDEPVLLRYLGAASVRPDPRRVPAQPITVTAALVQGRLRLEWAVRAPGWGVADRCRAHAEALVAIAEHCRRPDAGGASGSDFPLAGLDDDELALVLDNIGERS